MPKMTLNRDYTLRSLTGHMVGFEANVPVHVPTRVVKEALAVGALLEEGEDAVKHIAPATLPAARFIDDAEELRPLVKDIILALKDRDQRGDFTAAGRPALKAVALYGNIDPKCLTGALIDEIWEEVK